MKRVTLVLLLVVGLAPSTSQAFPFYALIGLLLPPGADRHADADSERGRLARPLSNLDFLLSTFDKEIISKFRLAWERAGNGTESRESVVLILKMVDGSYSARLPNPTNEYKSFSFAWHPATVAIVHTHPNSSAPYPEDGDLVTAKKFNVPVFTLTSRGMFVYDPTTRKTSKVLDGLNWKDDSAWQKIQAHLADR